MTQPNRSLFLWLTVILLVGLFAAKIDAWARANSESYLGSVQLVFLVVVFFGLLFQSASGRLKSRPDRRKSTDGTAQTSATPVLMAGYLFVLAVSAAVAVLLGVRLHDYVASPLIHYLVFVPFALIYVIGRYRVDRRNMGSANDPNQP